MFFQRWFFLHGWKSLDQQGNTSLNCLSVIVIVFIPCRKAAALVGYWECHSKRNLRGISLIVQSKRWLWNLDLLLQKQERSLISFLIKQPRACFSIHLSVLHFKATCKAFQLFLTRKLIIRLDSCRYLELPIPHLQLLLYCRISYFCAFSLQFTYLGLRLLVEEYPNLTHRVP